MNKPATKSRTFWFNTISGIVVLFPLVAPYVGFDLKLTADQITVVTGLICAVNLWLRRVTDSAIRFFKNKPYDHRIKVGDEVEISGVTGENADFYNGKKIVTEVTKQRGRIMGKVIRLFKGGE